MPEAALPCSSRTRDNFPSDRPPLPSGRDRPVSRRSKPSSRSPLMGEQPHPWPLLQDRDGKSRHRTITLLLPEVVDYISILFQLRKEESACDSTELSHWILLTLEDPQSLRGHSNAFSYIQNFREDSFFRSLKQHCWTSHGIALKKTARL